MTLETTREKKLSEHFSLYEMIYSETAVSHHIDNMPNETEIENLKYIHVDLNWDGSLKKTSGFTGGGANNSAVKIDQEMCIQLWPET